MGRYDQRDQKVHTQTNVNVHVPGGPAVWGAGLLIAALVTVLAFRNAGQGHPGVGAQSPSTSASTSAIPSASSTTKKPTKPSESEATPPRAHTSPSASTKAPPNLPAVDAGFVCRSEFKLSTPNPEILVKPCYKQQHGEIEMGVWVTTAAPTDTDVYLWLKTLDGTFVYPSDNSPKTWRDKTVDSDGTFLSWPVDPNSLQAAVKYNVGTAARPAGAKPSAWTNPKVSGFTMPFVYSPAS
ncbi:hypothetical protein AB0C11_33430 [Streptomyces sp. NPDC039016]|uniref:hypothetical protein n=1 Tax=Streptomyces sp. NPDC039016 TaxID=3154330 RepID=UPI0033DD8E0D